MDPQYIIEPIRQQQPQLQYQDYHGTEYHSQSYQGHDYGQAYYDQTSKPLARAEAVEDTRRASVFDAKGRLKPNYRPMALRWWYILILSVTCLALAGLVIYAEQSMRNSDDTAVIEGRGIEFNYNKMIHDEAWDRYRKDMRLWGRQDGTQAPPQVDAQPTLGPPAEGPPTQDPPTQDPPTQDPPTQDPPTQDPPVVGGQSSQAPVQTEPPPPPATTVPDKPIQPDPSPQSPSARPADPPAQPTQPGPSPENPPVRSTQADPPPESPPVKQTQVDPPPVRPTQSDQPPPQNPPVKPTQSDPPPNTQPDSPPQSPPPAKPTQPDTPPQSPSAKPPPADPPATSGPPDKSPPESERSQKPPPAATNDLGDKSQAPGTTGRAPIADAEETTPGQAPSSQNDAGPTPKPSPSPESPISTTMNSDGSVPGGIVTSAWVEIETTSWVTEPGKTSVYTSYKMITMTSDETETVTSTRAETRIAARDEQPIETQISSDKDQAIPTPRKITTTYVTTYTMMKVARDEDGNFIIQPATTVTYTTTYRSGSVKTVPIMVTTVGPPLVYPVTGKTTIFSTFTIDPVQGKQIMGPTTRTLTSDVPAFLSTIVETPAPVIRTTYGPDGLPTAVTETFAPITRVITVPASRVVLTETSIPTAALQDLVVVSATTYTLTSAGYYVGKFVPVLIAVILVLAIRAVDMTAQQYQPFASLARPQGAAGRDSLTLDFEGWAGLWRPLRLARQGQWVPLLANTAYLVSIAIPPVTSEAIGIKVHGRCSLKAIQGCALNLGVSRLWCYILAGLLVVTALVLLVVLVVVSRRWRTGVFADPWCVAGAAALARNPELARVVGAPDFRAVKADVAKGRYALGWFRNIDGRDEYGLVLQETYGRLQGHQRDDSGVAMMPHPDVAWVRPQNGPSAKVRRPPRTFTFLTVWWRLLFLFYLVALLGVVLFYHGRRRLIPEKVRWFMEGGNKYGSRLITSGLGVAAMIGWDCIFDSVAVVAPYRLMADELQPGSRSVLAGRPTYAVTGIWAGIRNRDWLLGLTAFMTVMSHFLPMLFANVPYNLTQMEAVHTICSRLSAGLLAMMIVVLGAAFLLEWPEMPVDPRTIAGQMWYVAQSSAVDLMDGVSSLNGHERKKRLEMLGPGAMWTFGMVRTPFGDRVGVELLDFRAPRG